MVMVIMQKFLRYLAFSNRIVEILEKKKMETIEFKNQLIVACAITISKTLLMFRIRVFPACWHSVRSGSIVYYFMRNEKSGKRISRIFKHSLIYENDSRMRI